MPARKLPYGAARNIRLTVTVTESEARRIKRASEFHEITVSDFLREEALKGTAHAEEQY